MSFSTPTTLVLKYKIFIEGRELTDDIIERIHDNVCRSGLIETQFIKDITIGIRDRNKIEIRGEIEDPLITIINGSSINYNHLCNVCNDMYSRVNFDICERCITNDNFPRKLKPFIETKRIKALNFKYAKKL